MEEEWDEARNTAAKWNLDCRPPNEVKARNAARYGQKVFCEFAQEMWRACGMRVVILVGWKQEDGNIVTAIGDFDDEIGDGEKFQGSHKISVAWDKYIGTHFEPAGEPNTDNADSEEESNHKQKQKCKRADPTTQVTCEDGEIWIGDLAGTLSEFDPSHMKTSEALQFLQFIQARQKEHPDNVFKFHHWIDENGDLQESKEDEDDAKSLNEDSVEAPSSTSRKEQLTRGKGKGKETNKGKAPVENVGGVRDIGNMQPIGQVAAKNAERPQLCQKGAAKPKAPAPSRQAI
ncbi:hypothetical protein PAXRUDRAFT_21710 [Paxillus rubicundulus Ve08.2h10]|uniref:Uncharacterized protein n=1 Tax=Paxillus rubicundulus Ve08.2h10 TaxID=930991 RepID=A0A0D0CPE2_9AGAM|nr:hypothetical protein PAXRUDRAFT_21710 [Paxillus rubicundulus Ve08.2h10]